MLWDCTHETKVTTATTPTNTVNQRRLHSLDMSFRESVEYRDIVWLLPIFEEIEGLYNEKRGNSVLLYVIINMVIRQLEHTTINISWHPTCSRNLYHLDVILSISEGSCSFWGLYIVALMSGFITSTVYSFSFSTCITIAVRLLIDINSPDRYRRLHVLANFYYVFQITVPQDFMPPVDRMHM